MKEITCIICPQGCRLRVDEDRDFEVTGNRCIRGVSYGKSEVRNPVRILTSTVRIKNGSHPRLPVKSDRPLPKEDLMEAMAVLDEVELEAPVNRGDVILEGILGTSVNIVATRDMAK
ncbi:MAG TPA: DUF1667 domain-containing protein [Clostridiaceae bacterium]|nr:DUF1667 domain-containing protein [Clostridiaceae bacterium]